jgi:hypothetical protein
MFTVRQQSAKPSTCAVARRQSGIDSPDGQSIRPSSSIQSNADLRACSAPNNLSTARMKADSSFQPG